MKFLRHKLRDVPPRNTWETMRKPKNVFYKNVDYDFLRTMNARFNLHVCSGNDIFDDNSSTLYFSNSSEDKYSIVFCMGSESNPETIELTLIEDFGPPNEVFKENDLIYAAKEYVKLYRNHRDTVRSVDNAKRTYLSNLEQFERTLNELSGFGRRQRLMKSLGIVNYLKTFEFNDVVAEDTCCEGDDIDLGTLKFQVNFQNSAVYLIEGTYPRSTPWGDTFHPHDLGKDGICLGSQSADMAEAIKNFEIDIIQVMLYKFAHSYTSSDSAGGNWRKWTDGGDTVYSEYHGEEILLSEAVQLENGEWISEGSSVTLTDGRIYPSGWATWSEYYEGYIDEDIAVWSNHLNSNIDVDDDNIVKLFNGDYSDMNHPEIFEYDGNYYIEDEETVEDINGDTVPKHLTVYSQVLSNFILASEVIIQNGEYYTADTLPAVEETTTDVEETAVERPQ